MTVPAVTRQYEEYVRMAEDHLWVQFTPHERFADPDLGLLLVTEGEGVYVKDTKGNRYIDALSGLYCVAVGHGREELAQAAADQIRKIAFVNPLGGAHPVTVELAAKLAELTPGDINKIFFVSSGSEAVEVAIRIAKQYHYNNGDRKRYKVISRIGSYHGQTAQALTANASIYAAVAKPALEPLVPGAVYTPGVYCYACPFEKTYPECDVFCARYIEQLIQNERPETIACLIAEPISSTLGTYVPPPEYWPTLRQICDKYGILLIADEVINGFGRTGKWWGIQHFGVQPDMMTVAKAITSAQIPMAAAMVSDRVADAFKGDPARVFTAIHTFGGHPVAAAVSLANIDIMERERLVENAAAMGEYLMGQLNGLSSSHRTMAEVRGKGLLTNIQLVKDVETRRPFMPEDRMDERMTALLRRRGLLSRAGDHIDLSPPLSINRKEVDEIVGIVDDALTELERSL